MNPEIQNYLNSHTPAKLQLGCGKYLLDDWLNTDIIKRDGVVYLDVSKPFDIPDESFDYIYSEHLFEHLTYKQEQNMISECYRILKPSGVMRISTPNIEFLIDLYLHPDSDINKKYIEFDSKRNQQPNDPIYAINNFHTNWGHQIIHSPTSLIKMLNDWGFQNVYPCEIGKSKYECLCGIESHSKHFKSTDCDFNELQSMVFEAQK